MDPSDDVNGDDSPTHVDTDAECAFCGGSLDGQPFLALGLFAVVSDEGDGMLYQPAAEAVDALEWGEVQIDRCLHLTCVENYCAGVLTEADAHRRQGGAP